MIECRSCSKTQDPDLFTNDMVRRQAGKQQDRQDRQDITTVYYEFTEIVHTKIPSCAVKKLRDFEHTIKIPIRLEHCSRESLVILMEIMYSRQCLDTFRIKTT